MATSPDAGSEDQLREIARVAYADMLHDHERNHLYECAIQKTIRRLIEKKQATGVRVVDIGTGTGLLSMIAVRSGGHAVSVKAFDSCPPIADCARKIIAANGYESQIMVTTGRGEDGRMEETEEAADLLITELFDTELIGEGAIPVYRSALTHLCVRGCQSVPSKGQIWIQLLASPFLTEFNQFNHPLHLQLSDGSGIRLNIPEQWIKCPGSDHLHDFQVNQLRPGVHFSPCSEPQKAFEFSFTDIEGLQNEEEVIMSISLKRDVRLSELAILFWWDLHMDEEAEFLLSTRPKFSGSGTADLSHAWREHWIQAVYYPSFSRDAQLQKSELLQLRCHHDEYSFQFSAEPNVGTGCCCGIHNVISRSRLKFLNQWSFLEKQLEIILKILSNSSSDPISSFLYIGSASYLPLVVAKRFPDKRISYFSDRRSDPFFQEFADANDLSLTASGSDVKLDGTFVLMEPYVDTADLPVDVMSLFDFQSLSLLPPDRSLINRVVVKCLPVQFNHLWKTQAPVGPKVLGFDVSHFDELIQSASKCVDESVESYALWEYSARSLCHKSTVLFDLNWQFLTTERSVKTTGTLDMEQSHIIGEFGGRRSGGKRVVASVLQAN